ncbi:MAG: hypothetical protein KatS3mg125_1711 [Lysobacterales bacterium]|nr:MAG: hypothetical protein KatS3mg125_1711 [Xanthomonadales bacterium]
MKVFLDTNVLLSGILACGICADLLAALIRARAELMICAAVRPEFTRDARTKFRAREGQIALAEEFFTRACQEGASAAVRIPGAPDEADAATLAAALAAYADWFVTGDEPPQDLGSTGAKIVSARTDFLRLRGIERRLDHDTHPYRAAAICLSHLSQAKASVVMA